MLRKNFYPRKAKAKANDKTTITFIRDQMPFGSMKFCFKQRIFVFFMLVQS